MFHFMAGLTKNEQCHEKKYFSLYKPIKKGPPNFFSSAKSALKFFFVSGWGTRFPPGPPRSLMVVPLVSNSAPAHVWHRGVKTSRDMPIVIPHVQNEVTLMQLLINILMQHFIVKFAQYLCLTEAAVAPRRVKLLIPKSAQKVFIIRSSDALFYFLQILGDRGSFWGAKRTPVFQFSDP